MTHRSIKRILHDINDMKGHEEEGLYYFPFTENIYRGYGLIIGPPNTPYERGFYLIHFTFPDSYPNEPPVCRYVNFSGLRQSPNFHDNGTVCLSRLNTWDVDDPKSGHWIGSMDIYAVLNMIRLSVLTNNPLDHEPPYDHSKKDLYNSVKYDYVVQYTNYAYNVVEMYEKISQRHTNIPDDISEQICSIMNEYISTHYMEYINRLHELQSNKTQQYTCRTYLNASCLCDYGAVLNRFKDMFKPNHNNRPKIVIKKK